MATTETSLNGRTPDTLRREIERERRELAEAVEQLRDGLGEATNVAAKLRSNLPVVAAGASGPASSSPAASATMRFLARKGRER